MNKIPLAQTIAFGYAFLITEIWTVLRICRIPALLVVGVDYLWRRYILFYASEEMTGGFAIIEFLTMSSVLFVYLLASSVMAVGVTRAVMGKPLNSDNYYFPLGRTEWRMLGTYIQYALSVFVLLFFAGLVAAIALAMSGYDFNQPAENQAAGSAVLIASLLSAFVFGYVLVVILRLAFFLPAVVVAEDASLVRAYGLVTGNLWRMFVVLVAVAAPILIVGTIFQSAIIYSAFGEGALSGGAVAVMEKLEAAAAARPLLWAAYGFVNNIAIMGIVPSAAAFAYMKLTAGAGETRDDTTPPPRA